MAQHLRPARGVPPGRIIARELEARGWTQRDLAAIMGRPPQAINEIIRGTKQITPDTALALAAAFGTSPELWSNLEAAFRLFLASQQATQHPIERRARLYQLVPLAELQRRGWLPACESLDELESAVCSFLGIADPTDEPLLAANFRHTRSRTPEAMSRIAWVRRVESLARLQDVAPFDPVRLEAAIPELLAMAENAEDVGKVPGLLLSLGVGFVIVPHLPKTYLDGAALTVAEHPVVALTLRIDRIDSFWFTLLHELAHILRGHGELHLDNFEARELDDQELEADRLAKGWLLQEDDFRRFVATVAPRFSRAAILHYAAANRRHAAVVLGRLQFDKLVGYGHLRELLTKVSPFLVDWVDVPAPERALMGE